MEKYRRLIMAVAVCALIACLPAATQAKVIYVDDAAGGANDGSSWEDAFPWLQDALAVVTGGDEIRVAQGVYRPDQGAGVSFGDREAAFHFVEGIRLCGGYAGAGAADPDARDFKVYTTILSGDCNGDDSDVEDANALEGLSTRTDNSQHVIVVEQVDSGTVEGFVICGGHAADGGGGLRIVDSSLTLRNCTFARNWGFKGGAMFISISNANQAVAVDCLFRDNQAVAGGAICGNPTAFHGCRFTGNVASDDAGVLEGRGTLDGWTLACENCLFDGNRAFNGNSVMVVPFGTIEFTNCTLVGNRSLSGSAFNVYGQHGGPMPNVFTNCIIWGEDQHFDSGWWLAKSSVTYCAIQGGYPGQGNIDADPLFVDLGRWDTKGTIRTQTAAVWIAGEYHLMSQAGRWDPTSGTWVLDEVTSPCIDAGDPNCSVGDEPEPNGERVNMGAYGGTSEASLSFSGE